MLLAFHLLLRPAEALNLRWSDITMWDAHEAQRFIGSFGIVAIRAPKTRRMVGHAPHQHVLLEDEGLARLLQWARSHVPPWKQQGLIFQGKSSTVFAIKLKEAARALGVDELRLTPAGLRGGGATDFFLRTREVDGLRRRGRWTNLKTLERYVQEGAAQVQMQKVGPTTQRRIEQRAALATLFFLELLSIPPPPHRRPQ